MPLSDNDHFKDECGVVGILGDPEAANLIYLALYALQHRGQEACGIVTMKQTNERWEAYAYKAFGLVSEQIGIETLRLLVGNVGIGHVRYATHGGRLLQNIQPLEFRTPLHG